MKVVVCGAGKVGFSIARYLAADKADVTVIDQSPELIQKVQDSLDVRGFVGFASHPNVLDEAGLSDADMLIAVTLADEVNMVACQIAHSLFDVPTKIARVRGQAYLDPTWRSLFSRDHLPIDHIISPEIEVAQAVARRLMRGGVLESYPFLEGRAKLIGLTCGPDTPIINTPLRQIAALFPDLNIVVVGLTRGERVVIPSAKDQLLAGDEVYFVVETAHEDRAMAAFGFEAEGARRILVLGGGNIGVTLASTVESQPGVVARLIEHQRDRAQFAAQSLDRTVVLQGDALDPEILEEAGVDTVETVVAVTNDDRVNIIASLLAKRYGAGRAVTLVNDPMYSQLIRSLGVDVVVSPRSITVSSILQHVRRGRIRSVYSLGEGFGEVIEADALETSDLTGKPLGEATLPDDVVVAAVLRGADDRVEIPNAETVIEAGDRVLIFAGSAAVRRVERILRVRPDFF